MCLRLCRWMTFAATVWAGCQIVDLYQTYDYTTQVLAASIRNTLHILQCAEVGADVVTCPLSAIKGLLTHPLTDIGLEKFLADYRKVNG